MRLRRGLSLLLLLVAASGCGRRGGGVLLGAGETISHLADFTPEARTAIQNDTGFAEPAVGFKYEYFSVLFLDLWTGGGEVVFYDAASGDEYVQVTGEELQASTSMSSSDFGKPFLYRFPLGWFVIVAVVGTFGFVTWRRMRDLG